MEKKLHCGDLFKRVLSLALAIVMVLGFAPVPHAQAADVDTTVYLKPNSNWLIDNARFAIYYWNDSGSYWIDMSDADGDGYYEGVVPAGYSNIIFCRMNPSTTVNDWENANKWNQTSDLTLPTDGTNCYTVADGTWDDGGGTWSTYTPSTSGSEETAVDYYLIGYINGADYGCEADYANLGEYKFVDGKLTATFTQDSYVFVKTGDNAKWYMTEGYPGDTATSATLYDTSTGLTDANKLKVPANIEVVFTLVENEDGTLTLSYTKAGSEEEGGEEEETSYTATIHYQNSGNWEKVYAYAWTDNGTLLGAWPGTEITANVNEDNAGWYDLVQTTDAAGFNFIFNNNNGSQTGNLSTGALTGDVELWVSGDTVSTTAPENWVTPTAVTLHFMKPAAWGSNINAYLWTDSGAVAGYSDYNAWPGKAVSDADGDGWYDLVVETESKFNFIFNDGGNQTADLTTPDFTDSIELWVVDNTVYTEQPDYTAVIHFQKPSDWNEVYAYVWNPFAAQGESNAIPGYESYNGWPGAVIEENAANAGWYDLTVTKETNVGFNFVFNNNNGTQTGDLWSGELSFNTELWFYADETQAEGTPAGWSDPTRTVHVPGTFPGPSWDAASNQMTYVPDLGLYVYTFKNVPPANYAFKIAINGSWDENYGVGGERDGDNIAVAVPETMAVTVYYSDVSHRSVTSVDYKFLDIDLAGTGIPEGTKMTDEGLTGIYKATVSLEAGVSYEDIQMTVDGETYTFAAFELENAKDVTFYYDPASGFYYSDAIPSEIDENKVHYDSQDLEYKDPYGAVATGEEVTFSIETGAEVQQVSLVITGLEKHTVQMVSDLDADTEADGTTIVKWSGIVTLNTVGEYDYYFILTDGNGIVVYGDDDGYYGEGEVTDLDKVTAYDLVVYKADYETPDWMKDAVIYQIFPDRFFDGDESNNKAQTWARGDVNYEYITDWYTLPENPEQEATLDEATYKATGAYYGDGEWSNEIYGGDLQGIIERIDYLKALGVNVIYLNPVFWSISNHRYDAVDYTEIDPILGTLGDFEELVRVAEANGMHIILDGVFNHVSDDSVYFDRYYKFLGKSKKIGAYPYWAYVYDYMAENSADQATAEAAAKAYFTEKYGITDYSYTEWFAVSSTTMSGTVDKIGLRAGKEVYSYEGWWGYDSMPIIYATNGSEYQTGNWAEEIINDPNGTDSVTEYWISKGMDGWRLDVANEVSDETWQNFRDSVKALNSNAVIIGEIWEDATKYLMGDMYDSVMNYQFRNAVTGFAMGTNAETTTKTMEKIRERYPEEAFYAMMNLVGSHDTTRILSYLDGIGDDRADKSLSAAFPTYASTSNTAKSRQYLVSFLQFTYAGAPTIYYGDEIGMVGSDDPDDRRAFGWGKGNQELVEWYATLAAIREAYPALRTGSVQPIDTNNSSVMGFVRADDANTLTVLANNSASAQTVTLEGTYVDLISGKTFDGIVPAYNGVILVAEEEVKTVSVDKAGLAPAYDSTYIVKERSETPHVHDYTEKVVDAKYLASAADCENAATYYYSCECGKKGTETFADGEALGHAWDEGKITTEPDCENEGVKTFTCERGCTKTEAVKALGHSYEAVVTEPTCTEQGYTTYTCSVCGDSYVDDYVDALGHDYVDGACTRCGEKDPNSVPAETVKPAWKSWLDKIFGKWFGDKDETPTEPSEPETSEPETSEPETTEPEESVPAETVKPAKPNWSGIVDWFRGLWG